MLTLRQGEYLSFIRRYSAEFGRVPTPAKIALEFGVNHSTVTRMIDSLCATGELEQIIGRAANYTLAANGLEALPYGLQSALLMASERAAMRPKALLAQIVREYCERQRG